MPRGRIPTVAVVLTARTKSNRNPRKVLEIVEGKPLLYWIAQKLSEVGHVILAIPEGDTLLIDWGKAEGLDTFEGSEDDVTGRIMGAVKEYQPDAQYIMRGLGDCPLLEPSFSKRAHHVLHENSGDAFVWALPPFTFPVYGTQEFPRSRKVWDETNEKGIRDTREHPDLYYHRHRDRFKIIYHDPPPPVYFRPYRLEVDWSDDLELIRKIAKHFGKMPTLKEAIEYLDKCDDARINRLRSEKTGMTASYRQSERTMWWKLMINQPIVMWDDTIYKPVTNGQPVYCRRKSCLLGYAVAGQLHRLNGEVISAGIVSCPCGTGRTWSAK